MLATKLHDSFRIYVSTLLFHPKMHVNYKSKAIFTTSRVYVRRLFIFPIRRCRSSRHQKENKKEKERKMEKRRRKKRISAFLLLLKGMPLPFPSVRFFVRCREEKEVWKAAYRSVARFALFLRRTRGLSVQIPFPCPPFRTRPPPPIGQKGQRAYGSLEANVLR